MNNPYSTNGLIRKAKQNFQRTFFMKGATGDRSIYWRMMLTKVLLEKEYLVEVTQDHVKIFTLKLGVPLSGS
jgi:hypothetical protein